MLAGNDNAKLKSLINYDYYNPKFHFCEPDSGPKKEAESLGSILFGDRIFNSPYDIKMLKNETCRALCVQQVPGEDAKFINDRIREDYALNWLVDGLPAAEMKVDTKTGDLFFDMGFNLGNDDGDFVDAPALNNHYEIVLRYHEPSPGVYRVVGVLVWPTSRGGSQDIPSEGELDCTSEVAPLILQENQMNTVRYSYRVMWNESSTPWATRWDNYLHIFDPRIHWFSLINSIVIVVFLCIMVSMILLRTVSRDISRYNAIDLSEDVQEDWGWKLVHGEVFRTPQNPMILSVLVGNGAQLCAMVAVTLVFALLGFFHHPTVALLQLL
ncbi:Transmembrane 9 superfamily member 1 [Grifola frondosa]|uniref:Transmembrane 9 superfamily member n=1 Tax=Grifola frondosa TaxID=5627 RepID=A0A1C7LQQ2_GRIFR|nr:Transmembrane 9 superfamily member 1 [Grifola frondosa]